MCLNEIKDRIAIEIKSSGLSQNALAHALDISQSAVSLYAQAKVLPSLDTFVKICRLLDLDASMLLQNSDK